MRYLMIVFAIVLFSGCATWNGIKQDTKSGANWTKSKVHEGAVYIEKKTK